MLPENDDTTREGVSADEVSADTPVIENQAPPQEADAGPEPEPEKPVSERDRIYAEARERRRKELKLDEAPQEPAEETQEGDEGEAAPTEAQAENGRPRDAQGRFQPKDGKAAPAKASGKTEPAAPEPTYKLKIDGVEEEWPLSKILQNVQKAGAADKRLREAAQERERFRKEREEWERSRQTAQQPTPQPTPTAQQQPAPGEALDVEELARALTYGDQAQTAEALRKIIAQKQGEAPTDAVDPQQIAEMATQQAVAQIQWRNSYQSDIDRFATEYPDIAQDTRLGPLTAQRVNELRVAELALVSNTDFSRFQYNNPDHVRTLARMYRDEAARGTVPPDFDLYRRAGDETRQWIGGFAGQSQQTTPGGGGAQPTVRVERVETLKENLHQPPSGASQRSPIGGQPQAKTGRTPQEIIAWQQRTRGQMPNVG